MLKLNLTAAKSLTNTRTSKFISFRGIVAKGQKGGFAIPPALAKDLQLGDGDSVVLIANDDVVNGIAVKKFYLAKGLRFEAELDANGQPVKVENSFKVVYKPNTGVGSIVRLSETQMLNFTSGGAWNHLNGRETVNVKYSVSEVVEAELPTGFKDGEETFTTLAVEILLDSKESAQGMVRPKGAKAEKAETTMTATTALEDSMEDEDEDESWDEEEA